MSQKSIEQPEKEPSTHSNITHPIEPIKEPPEVIENTQEKPKRKKFLGLF